MARISGDIYFRDIYYFRCQKCGLMLKYRILVNGAAEVQTKGIPKEELVAAKLRGELSTVTHCRLCSPKNEVFRGVYGG